MRYPKKWAFNENYWGVVDKAIFDSWHCNGVKSRWRMRLRAMWMTNPF